MGCMLCVQAPAHEAAEAEAAGGAEERVPESYDDAEFYQQLLKEFLEGSAAAGARVQSLSQARARRIDCFPFWTWPCCQCTGVWKVLSTKHGILAGAARMTVCVTAFVCRRGQDVCLLVCLQAFEMTQAACCDAGRQEAAQAGGQARIKGAQAALPRAREVGQFCGAARACDRARICNAALC